MALGKDIEAAVQLLIELEADSIAALGEEHITTRKIQAAITILDTPTDTDPINTGQDDPREVR